MKTGIIAVLTIISTGCFSQIQPGQYLINLGKADIGYTVQQIGNTTYISGYKVKTGLTEYYVISLNDSMVVNWQYRDTTAGLEVYNARFEIIDTNFILGHCASLDSIGNPFTYYTSMNFYRINKNGILIWKKKYRSTPYTNTAVKSLRISNRSFVISGHVGTSQSSGYRKYYLGMFDTSGNTIWEKSYGDSTKLNKLYDATRTTDGGYLLCGTRDDGNDKDIYIVKTDSLGNMEWDRVYGSVWDDGGFACLEADSGKYLVAGAKGVNSLYFANYCLLLDSLGGLLWDYRYSTPFMHAYSEYHSGLIQPDSSVVFIGGFRQTTSDSDIGLLQKLSFTGNELWTRTYTYNPDYHQYLWDIAQTNDNGFIMVGQAIGPQGQDVWIVKTDSLGCLVAGCDTATGTAIQIVPGPGNELQAWPNPARDVLYVAHNRYTGHEVSYRLISLSGQVVQSGTATLPKVLGLPPLPVGMYVLQVSTAEGTLIGTSKVAISR